MFLLCKILQKNYEESIKRDHGQNLFSFLSVNEYADKDSLDDTGGFSPASCSVPCFASKSQTCSHPERTHQLIPFLRMPGYAKEEFTTSLQLFHPADSTGLDYQIALLPT